MLTEPDSRFTLFYGNRDSHSVIFLEELARLKNRFMDRLQVHHFLAEEAEDSSCSTACSTAPNATRSSTHLVDPAEVAAFFICGPGPMMDAAEEALARAAASPKDRIHIERFTAGRPSAALEAQMQALPRKRRA